MKTLSDTKYKRLAISIFILGLIVSLIFLFFYPSRSELGDYIVVDIIYMYANYIAYISGVLFLLARLFRIINQKTNLLYIFTGAFTSLLGILNLLLFLFRKIDKPWFHECSLVLLLGFFITIDIYVLKMEK
jgi:hypothetical protein